MLNKPRSYEEITPLIASLIGHEPSRKEVLAYTSQDNADNWYISDAVFMSQSEEATQAKLRLLLGKASKSDLAEISKSGSPFSPGLSHMMETVPNMATMAAAGPVAAVEGGAAGVADDVGKAASQAGFLGRVGSKIKGAAQGAKSWPWWVKVPTAIGTAVVGTQVASHINQEFLGGHERALARKAAEQEQELGFLREKAKIAAEQAKSEADLKTGAAMSPDAQQARQKAKAEDVQRDLLKRQLDEVYAPSRFDNILLGIQAISPNTDYVEKAFNQTP